MYLRGWCLHQSLFVWERYYAFCIVYDTYRVCLATNVDLNRADTMMFGFNMLL